MNWIQSDNGYSLALDGNKLVCQNSKGKILSSVPKAARESTAGEQLIELRGWLERHRRECQETVERWILRSLPVPLAVLEQIFPDPDWQAPLLNLLVEADGEYGFLREVSQRGLGIVDLDGESHWKRPAVVHIPHPILLPELADYREVMVELGLTQQVTQLFRESWLLPEEDTQNVKEFAYGKFAQILHVQGKAKGLGFPVRGGYACCNVFHDGQVVQARYWIGSGSPDEETETGELFWVDKKERPLSAFTAGPVAYSEGMRMASLIFAARVVEKEEGQQ